MQAAFQKRLAEGLGQDRPARILAFKSKVISQTRVDSLPQSSSFAKVVGHNIPLVGYDRLQHPQKGT